jgi:hypothetical protein
MLGHGRHRVHVWLGDVLDDDGDVVVPTTDGLVVRRGQESPVAVNKGDRVDRAQMLIVGLDDFS